MEDSSLLPLCGVVVDGSDQVSVIVKGQGASAILGRSLSGKANNGDAGLTANQDNVISLDFSINLAGQALKEDDLKNLYFTITSLDA